MSLPTRRIPRPLYAALLCALLTASASWGQAQQDGGRQAPEGSRENPILMAIPDSLRSVVLTDSTREFVAFEVRGERIQRQPEGGRDLIGLGAIQTVDPQSAADLAPLLPSTRLSTNSRGEALFSIRGSTERQIGVFWDEIPLTVPWDERVDLSLVPVDALGGVRALRGMPDLAGGPQVLAGRVELLPWRLPVPGAETRISVGGGEIRAYEARFAHARHSVDGRWQWLLAGGRRDREGWVLPEDFEAPYHQNGRVARVNSDLASSSGLLSVRHLYGERSELRLLLLGSDSEKGVPPELHVPDARFWRYPMVRRGLVGVSGLHYAGADQRWRLSFAGSADVFQQDIRNYDDLSYTTPALVDSVDYEEDRDLTWYGRAAIRRSLGRHGDVELSATGRRTQHDETLIVGGAEERYVHSLASLVGEWTLPLTGDLHTRIGGGVDRASTSQAGPRDPSDPENEPVWLVALEHRPEDSWHSALRYSRRGRAPSLREAYSGALGRFLVNPDLGAERQDLVELDVSRAYERFTVSGALFASLLDGAIERVAVTSTTFRRENVGELRVLGAEVGTQLVLPARLRAGLQLTALHARVKQGGEFRGYAEDRPEFLSSSWLGWVHPVGLKLRLENLSTGARASAGASGLLPAQTRWNLRAAYMLFGGPGPLSETELFARVDNVFDATLWSQTGLPEAGQTLWLGASFTLR